MTTLVSILLAVILSAGMLVPVCAAENVPAAEAPAYGDPEVVKTNAIKDWPQAYDINSDYGCLMDVASGSVLFSKGMNVKMAPASLTKIMTALLVIENCDLDSVVTMTETGVAYATDGSANLYTQVGEQFVLRDMLYGVMLKSANDMATQIGEFCGGGSLDTFIQMMNDRAAELGCKSTHFANACGMPADDHYTTAYNLCLISVEALKNPIFREIIGTSEYTIPATNMTAARQIASHHPFVADPAYAYEGTIGGKTGYTDAALHTLATFVKQDKRTLVCVTLHAQDRALACADAKALFDYGFENFANYQMKKTKNVLSGGYVTIPVGVDRKLLKAEQKTQTDKNNEKIVVTTYSYEGHPVGSAVQSKAFIDAKKAEAAAAKAAEEAKAASQVESVAEPPAEISAADTVASPETVNIAVPTVAEPKLITLPFGITMNRTVFIAIAVLSALIIIGIICIIVTLVARGSDYDDD